MNKQAIAVVLLIALIGAVCGYAIIKLVPRAPHAPQAPSGRMRIISLAPAMTETLFAIGAGADVVGRTEYCTYPPEAASLPTVGTTITPGYEAMVRLQPTLIVGEATKDAPLADLSRIAPTRLMPWLTLDDTLAGIRELGRLTGRGEGAEKIAADMERRLKVKPPANGPRVLLAMDGTPGRLTEVWFLRQNSIHGACLNAAGARNAVDDEFVGAMPVLSLERVIALDPEVVLVLTARKLSEGERQQLVKDWQGLPMLKAVKAGKVRVLDGEEYYVNGPRILGLIDKLKAALE